MNLIHLGPMGDELDQSQTNERRTLSILGPLGAELDPSWTKLIHLGLMGDELGAS